MIKAFKVLGYLEAASFLLLLCVAMPMKYLLHQPEAVRVVGMAHGVLFMAYVLMAVVMVDVLGWSKRTLALAFVAAVLPAGPIIFDRKYLKTA